MAFILLPFAVFSPQCSALRFNVSSVLLLAQENWYIWPSRTRPPQTTSSALTARGRWLKWACFFTPHSASSTGRLSGNLLLPGKKKKLLQGSFCIYILCSNLIVDILMFFCFVFYPRPCLQVWFLCKSSEQTSPSSQSGSSFWQSQNAWGERSRGHSRHARRWACQSNMELKSNENHYVLFSSLYTHTPPTDICSQIRPRHSFLHIRLEKLHSKLFELFSATHSTWPISVLRAERAAATARTNFS